MNNKNHRRLLHISLIVLAALFLCAAIPLLASQWIKVVSAPNFTLEKGENIPKTLLLLSQNVTLEETSSVDGSVIMLCCNMTVAGNVKGDVLLWTGNLTIAGHAEVEGDVNVISGNLSR